jgi:hypothetical protein
LVLAGPIIPQPTTPIVMRFEADGLPMAAHTLSGNTAAAPLICIKRRRLSEDPAPPPEERKAIVSSQYPHRRNHPTIPIRQFD